MIPLLSVIVPIYNEAATVDVVLRRLLAAPYPVPQKEIIVVNDGSTDGTTACLLLWQHTPGVTVLRHDINQGKGAAIRTGLARARGPITIIQDADLEYDPADMPRLIEPIRLGQASVVYGSRYLDRRTRLPWTKFRVAVLVLGGFVRLLYGVRVTDEATCYKAMRTDLLRALAIEARRFEFCPEVTAKLCRRGIPILEVPIGYRPRSCAGGKKIRWRDAWQAAWTLLQWRVARR